MDEQENVTCTYFGGSFLNYSHLDVIARCCGSPVWVCARALNSCHALAQKLYGIRKHLDSRLTLAGLRHTENASENKQQCEFFYFF